MISFRLYIFIVFLFLCLETFPIRSIKFSDSTVKNSASESSSDSKQITGDDSVLSLLRDSRSDLKLKTYSKYRQQDVSDRHCQ